MNMHKNQVSPLSHGKQEENVGEEVKWQVDDSDFTIKFRDTEIKERAV